MLGSARRRTTCGRVPGPALGPRGHPDPGPYLRPTTRSCRWSASCRRRSSRRWAPRPALGFLSSASAPFVRSSYNAAEVFAAVGAGPVGVSSTETVAFLDVSAGVAGDMCWGPWWTRGFRSRRSRRSSAPWPRRRPARRAQGRQGPLAATKVTSSCRSARGGAGGGRRPRDGACARARSRSRHDHAHVEPHGAVPPHGHAHRTLADVLRSCGARRLPPRRWRTRCARSPCSRRPRAGSRNGDGEVSFHEWGRSTRW